MTRVSFLEYHGTMYMFNKPYSFDEAWFIVKHMSAQPSLSKTTIYAMALIWSSQKKYGYSFDGKRIDMYSDEIMKQLDTMDNCS